MAPAGVKSEIVVPPERRTAVWSARYNGVAGSVAESHTTSPRLIPFRRPESEVDEHVGVALEHFVGGPVRHRDTVAAARAVTRFQRSSNRFLRRRPRRRMGQANSRVMPDEEDRVVATGPGFQDQGWPAQDDPADDWLSGDVDWDDTAETAAQARPGRRGGSSDSGTTASSSGGQSISDVVRRRRMIALGAIVGVIILIVVIAMVATGGGSNAPTTTPITTPAVTTPANTGATTTTNNTTPPSTGSSTKVTVPASGPLKQGDSGSAVKVLQKALNAVGSASLTVDGNFGPATTQAVIAFQTANGLTADGVVGPSTAKALNDALSQG